MISLVLHSWKRVQGFSLGDDYILQGEHANWSGAFGHLLHFQFVLTILDGGGPRGRDEDALHVHLEIAARFAEQGHVAGDGLLGGGRGTSGL